MSKEIKGEREKEKGWTRNRDFWFGGEKKILGEEEEKTNLRERNSI